MPAKEVWLRQLPVTLDPLRHLLLCTFTQTREEVNEATHGLTDEQIWRRPHTLTPLGFHLRHIAESIDRLLTYAEGDSLSGEQLEILNHEHTEEIPLAQLLTQLDATLSQAERRVQNLDDLTAPRHIGRARIPVPLGTLLAHVAEHTQRHLGQIATTAKLLR